MNLARLIPPLLFLVVGFFVVKFFCYTMMATINANTYTDPPPNKFQWRQGLEDMVNG